MVWNVNLSREGRLYSDLERYSCTMWHKATNEKCVLMYVLYSTKIDHVYSCFINMEIVSEILLTVDSYPENKLYSYILLYYFVSHSNHFIIKIILKFLKF